MDVDRIASIIAQEIRRYLEESQPDSTCECPPPAVDGASVQDGPGRPDSRTAARPGPLTTVSSGQKVLCLIQGEIERENEFWAGIQDLITSGTIVEALISVRADRTAAERRGVRVISNATELGNRYENLRSYRAILLPALDCTLAAKIALGISDDQLSEVTFAALSNRVPVLAAHERLLASSRISHTNNLPGLLDRIAQYRADLERMGILILPMKEMLDRARYTARVATPGSGEVITHLITVEDAKNLPGPVVRVARGGLITAMARDLLTQRGIKIEIVGE